MATQSGITTLVVDDDPSNLNGLVRLLQYTGLLVDSASTVADAVAKLTPKTKVVLLDLQLSDGSGAEVLHHIRKHGLKPSVGIVTGSSQPGQLEELEAFLPDAVFIKPYNVEALLKWVQERASD